MEDLTEEAGQTESQDISEVPHGDDEEEAEGSDDE